VAGYPAFYGHADGGDFFVAEPDAGVFGFATGYEAVAAEGADDSFFEGVDVPVDVLPPFGEVEDGVADELAGVVAGDVAAAVGMGDGDAFGLEPGGVGDEVFVAAAAADGDDGGVFEEDEDAVVAAAFDERTGFVLQTSPVS
jgi:hypothetical protein